MQKFFNTAGPCNPDEHYMISSKERLKDVFELMDKRLFFAIHAARQSGKTTLLMDFIRQINREGNYYALYCSLESLHNINDIEKGIPVLVKTLKRNIRLNPVFAKIPFAEDADLDDFSNVLIFTLSSFCAKLDKPLIVLFDEVDSLTDEILVTFLGQLRDGYINRNIYPFAHSVGLVGMKNIKRHASKFKSTGSSSNPFNIITETHILKNFSLKETKMLVDQHTHETGQVFSNDVIKSLYKHTQGQPWLVNYLATEVLVKMLGGDFSKLIIPDHINYIVKKFTSRHTSPVGRLLELIKQKRQKKELSESLIEI